MLPVAVAVEPVEAPLVSLLVLGGQVPEEVEVQRQLLQQRPLSASAWPDRLPPFLEAPRVELELSADLVACSVQAAVAPGSFLVVSGQLGRCALDAGPANAEQYGDVVCTLTSPVGTAGVVLEFTAVSGARSGVDANDDDGGSSSSGGGGGCRLDSFQLLQPSIE